MCDGVRMCDGCHREPLIEQCSNLVGSRVTPLPLSQLALALRTRTLAVISSTIAQCLLQLAALRLVLLVLVVGLGREAITQRRLLARRLASAAWA